MTVRHDMVPAVALIEAELGEEAAWQLGVIRNPKHMHRPYGVGVYVHINGPANAAWPDGVSVFEKGATSFMDAARRAVARYKRRQSGDKAA